MALPLRNGTLQAVVASCRACREPLRQYLARRDAGAPRGQSFADTVRCVALLSVVADTLERGDYCPTQLIDTSIELAAELLEDMSGCAAACQAAADALSDWLEGSYELP